MSEVRRYCVVRHAVRLACMLAVLTAFGLWLAQPVHGAGNFLIDDYRIDMQVNEDDTYQITETIDVQFTQASHGIYRSIPYRTTLDRDGQKSSFYGEVRDFQMLSGQPYEKSKGDEAYVFKIGDPDRYAEENTTYQFSYVFDMKGDHLKNADEVYYNLVGTSWEARSIDQVKFTVTFPKPIEMKNVGVKTGYNVEVPFESDGDRTVTGTTTEDTLTGLTIRAVLPEGYFTKQAGSSNLLLYLLTAILAAVTCAGFILWRRYGRDPQIVETEEFYPPEGLSAPEVAYLDTGSIEGRQITSMLLTLADKGYLKISEIQVPAGIRKKKNKTEYEITQVKAYDGSSEDEQAFMDGLFDEGSRSSVRMSDLKDSFYKTVNGIRSAIIRRYKHRLYDPQAARIAHILRLVGLIAMIALFAVSKLLNGSPFIVGGGDFVMYLVLDAMEIGLPLIGFLGITRWINQPKKGPKIILGFLGWGILILIGIGAAVLFDTCMGGQIPAYLIGLGMIFLLYLMAALCERKTDEYVQLLGKIRGFKRFLNVAEKERMEMLAEQDPNYFYKNLAFAFALGVTSVYAKRFASLATKPPQWYDTPYYSHGAMGTAFDSAALMDSMDSMMHSVSASMTSSPSDSGGGGSFSGGGGAGGGGGGSW
ncbi:MAG: DUF2207 domain-containing protein [Firmicutes bacterium]|nr:DUF2207 domain-containing protein [Bacillota bacterium]